MAYASALSATETRPAIPAIRKIALSDLGAALLAGVADFRAAPTQLVFLCIIYPLVGFVAARAAFGYEILPVLFPLLSGFALVGPVAAVGVYELSRRREQGQDVAWFHAFGVLRSPSLPSIAILACLFFAIFVAWLAAAAAIHQLTLGGPPPASLGSFMHDVFMTPGGWALIVAGNAVGFAFAALVLTLSVVSLPMLVDRNVGPVVALQTSVRAVAANPAAMAAWGLVVVACLLAGCALLFVGLAVVMPVLGHATWHLYRKVVVAG